MMPADAADAVIAEAEKSIKYWEARKPCPLFEGQGLQRICDSGTWDEAGLIRQAKATAADTPPTHGPSPPPPGGGGGQSSPDQVPVPAAPTATQFPPSLQAALHTPHTAQHPFTRPPVPQPPQQAPTKQLPGSFHARPAQAPGPLPSAQPQPSPSRHQPQRPMPQGSTPVPASRRPTSSTPAGAGRPTATSLNAQKQQLGRAIVRHAMLQSKLEDHEQLDWIDDLPSAPSTHVPPRAPRNP